MNIPDEVVYLLLVIQIVAFILMLVGIWYPYTNYLAIGLYLSLLLFINRPEKGL